MSLHMLRPTLGQDASMPKIFPKSIIHASLHLDIFWQRFAKDLQEIMQYDLCKYLLSDGIQTVILKREFSLRQVRGGGGDTPKLGRLPVSRFEKLQEVIFPVLFQYTSSKNFNNLAVFLYIMDLGKILGIDAFSPIVGRNMGKLIT